MELPYIFLQPDKIGVVPKGLGQPIGRSEAIKYDSELVEQNFENALVEFSDTSFDNSQFLFIELNGLSPWNSKVKDMLKNLNLELIKVFSPKIIIVKVSATDIPAFKEKIKAKHKYLKETIKSLGKWMGPRKVFSSLLEEKEKQHRQKVILSTFENISSQERQLIRSKFEKKLNDSNIKFNYNEEFFTYSCEASIEQIAELANETFIDNIRPTTQLLYSETKNERYSATPEFTVPVVQTKNLSPICVIDSGVSKFNENADKLIQRKSALGDSGEDSIDDDGHGTRVASIAMFGEAITSGDIFLNPKARIISHKIFSNGTKEFDNESDLLDIIETTVNESASETQIFNLSFNSFVGKVEPLFAFKREDDYFIYIDLATRLDRFIRKKNIILVNSVGNIAPSVVSKEKASYPYYLSQNMVLFPAFAKNIVSVGSVYENNLLSSFTRLGTPFENSSFKSEELNFIAPQILAFGGEKSFAVNPIKCINKKGEIKEGCGTSFSAPLVSLGFRLLLDKNPNIKTSEGAKAALLSACSIKNIHGKNFFILPRTSQIGNCQDNIIFNFEAEINPIYANYKTHQKSEPYADFKFFMPKGASRIEFVIINSSSHPYERTDESLFTPEIEIKRAASGKVKNKQISGNLDSYGKLHYGSFEFSRAGDNFWTFRVSFKHKTPVPEFVRDVKVRFGLSVKVFFKDSSETAIKKAYNRILEQHGIKIEIPTKETIEEAAESKLLNGKHTA